MRSTLNRPRQMICWSALTPTWLLVAVLGATRTYAQTGACCLGDAVCVVTDSSGCSVLSGEFLGLSTSCTTAVCTGACCLALPDNQGPGCSENLSRSTCLSSSGALSFQGAGTTCDLNCPSRLGTGFTYNGQLKQEGAPLTGTVDLEFSLWTSAEGGDQVESTRLLSEVDVVNGLFTVVLDFGADVFTGNSRFLEIAVRAPHDPTDIAPFITLTPRQELTATPYALHALSAPNGHALDAADGFPTDALVVSDAGNVGIGASPSFPLHVFTASAGRAVFGNNALAAGTGIGVWGQSASTSGRGVFGLASAPEGTNYGVYGSTASPDGYAGYFLGRGSFSGHVGIGTTNPLDELHVRGDQATIRLEADDDPDSFTLLNDAQPTQLRISKSNSSGSVFLDLSPKPLNGVSTGQVRLFRETNTTGAKGLSLHRGNNTAELSASIGVDGADTYFQMHGGYVGIGTSSPNAPLDVRGQCDGNASTAILGHNDCGIGASGRTSRGTGGIGVFGHATVTDATNYGVYGRSDSPIGFDFYAAGAGLNYGSTSSIRWKCNIESIEEPLQKLLRLRGVSFDWDQDHGGHHDVGMIAEEVGAVLPEIVSYEENGIDAHGMDYSKITPLLVEAIKALQSENAREIALLRTQNAELTARLERIEKRLASTR